MFRVANKNVARKEIQAECVAPTTARSPGRPPGCALMVASESAIRRMQPIFKKNRHSRLFRFLKLDKHECLA